MLEEAITPDAVEITTLLAVGVTVHLVPLAKEYWGWSSEFNPVKAP